MSLHTAVIAQSTAVGQGYSMSNAILAQQESVRQIVVNALRQK